MYAGCLCAGPRVSVPEGTYEVVFQQGCISGRQSLAVVEIDLAIWLPWELRGVGGRKVVRAVVLQVAADKHLVLAIGIDAVIELRDIRVLIAAPRRVEAVPDKVKGVPERKVVRVRIDLVEEVKNIRVGADSEGVHYVFQVGGRERLDFVALINVVNDTIPEVV